MRICLFVLASMTLAGCGRDEPSPSSIEQFEAKQRQEFILEQQREKAQFSKIEYPTCDNIWTGGKLSTCGNKLLVTSLKECRNFASDKLGGGAAMIDQWTGDSWQARAGFAATPIESRGKSFEPGEFLMEQLAYAKGNGTNEIGYILCNLDQNVRLESVSIL